VCVCVFKLNKGDYKIIVKSFLTSSVELYLCEVAIEIRLLIIIWNGDLQTERRAIDDKDLL